MKQTVAPKSTPSPQDKLANQRTEPSANQSPSSVFVSMALDMSWRLAIVVLVPIIGGFKLDDALHTTPLLTIVGFILAMGGVALVLWRTLQVANNIPPPKKDKK